MLTWLFTGFFRDNEYNELMIFCKYRPTFKVYFYSPVMQSDISVNDLSAKDQYEEHAFEEFVMTKQNRISKSLWYLFCILIQLTLTLMSFGLYRLNRAVDYKIWQLPIHFLINILLTMVLIGFIVVLDKMVWSISLLGLILISNYLIFLLLTKKQKVIVL
jgi:hypothetical protein